MLSRHLVRAINWVLDTVNDAGAVRDLASTAARHYEEVVSISHAAISAASDNKAAPLLAQGRQLIASATADLKKVRPGATFVQLSRLRSALQVPPPDMQFVDTSRLAAAADSLFESYEHFVARYGAHETVELLSTARRFEGAVNAFESQAAGTLAALEPEPNTATPHEARLELVLLSSDDLRIVAAKLSALCDLHDESAELLGVSTVEHPLRVATLEYGSLWVRVFGETRVIEFITGLIERAVSYFHRNFTNEGKLASLPRKIEALDDVLELCGRLKDAGLDTSLMDANVAKSGIAISQQLAILLAGEAKLEVNGQVHALAPTLRARFIEGRRRALGKGADSSFVDEPDSGTAGPPDIA